MGGNNEGNFRSVCAFSAHAIVSVNANDDQNCEIWKLSREIM